MRESASISTAALTFDGSCQATVMPGRTPALRSQPVAAEDRSATSDTVHVFPETSRSSGRPGMMPAQSSSRQAIVPGVTGWSVLLNSSVDQV